jgi:hypothetical protein
VGSHARRGPRLAAVRLFSDLPHNFPGKQQENIPCRSHAARQLPARIVQTSGTWIRHGALRRAARACRVSIGLQLRTALAVPAEGNRRDSGAGGEISPRSAAPSEERSRIFEGNPGCRGDSLRGIRLASLEAVRVRRPTLGICGWGPVGDWPGRRARSTVLSSWA